MTKTLTKQWRDGELPIDLYYVIDKLGRETIGNDCGIRDMMVDAFNGGNIFIKEVLAPVPSYDEYKRLQEQLNEANEVIQLNTFRDRFTLDITTDRFGNECKTFKPSDVYCRKYGLKYGWDYEPKQDCFVKWGVK